MSADIPEGLLPVEVWGTSAEFSDCGQYRYRLTRQVAHLSEALPGTSNVVTFIMLNPSTADAEHDDPTIRRCIGFARRWGFAELEVVNLFAFRATRPRDLLAAAHPTSEPKDKYRNFRATVGACRRSGMVVCAWGNGDIVNALGGELVLDQFQQLWGPRLRVLGFNDDGHPKHPLYVKGDVVPAMVLSRGH